MSQASIILCIYNEPLNLISECIESLLNQENISYEIVIVDSSSSPYFKKFSLPSKVQYIYAPLEGLSAARNRGVRAAKNDIIAFIDADCIADKQWLYQLCFPFEIDEKIAICGGKVIPIWPRKPPFFSKSNYAKFAISTLSLGETPRTIGENEMIVGANFAVKRRIIGSSDPFYTKLGRRDSKLLSGEETMLCQNVRRRGYKIFYTPKAIVYHKISPQKLTFKWMAERVFWGGVTRSVVGRKLLMSGKEIGGKGMTIYDILYVALFSIPYMLGYSYGRMKDLFDVRKNDV
ncbi:MAG: glycosyltransferase family 2 protein [Nitrososphaerota archaeon]|nr:glycosyltransferase family 2 protein [Nitrososphaerota archaeon]